MKKITFIFSVAAILATSAGNSFAQLDTLGFKPYFAVGPFFTAGAAIFAGTVQEGSKTGMTFAYTGGALGVYEISENFGVTLGLGYESRPIYFRDEKSADNWETTFGLNYISIQPGIKFGAFMVGVNINLPAGGQADTKSSILPSLNEKKDIADSLRGTVIDIRIGGLIPITHNKSSELNFFVQGCFGLTDAIKKQKYVTGDNAGKDMSTPVGTLQGGLCYTFYLGR